MKRFLSLTILLIIALTANLRAENAVRFSSVHVEPGERFSVDVTIETDSVLNGWNLVLRWSSSDLRCDSVNIFRESFGPRFLSVVTPLDTQARLIRFSLFPRIESPLPIVLAGSYLAGRLYFYCQPGASDQIAFVDSAVVVHIEDYRHDTTIETSSFSVPTGPVIYPAFYPGRITVGSPGSVSMRVAPLSVSLAGNVGSLSPVTATLEIQSESAIDFDWSASWSSNWLRLAPSVGKTPAYPSVSADAFFLLEGTYFDTLVISSNLAENSPIEVPVTFVVDTAIVIPPEEPDVSLYQNRPSPFDASRDPNTRIPFKLKRAEHVEIAIFDILGRRIKTLTSAQYGEGEAAVEWDGRNALGEAAASGHYICRMSTASGEQSRVIVLIR